MKGTIICLCMSLLFLACLDDKDLCPKGACGTHCHSSLGSGCAPGYRCAYKSKIGSTPSAQRNVPSTSTARTVNGLVYQMQKLNVSPSQTAKGIVCRFTQITAPTMPTTAMEKVVLMGPLAVLERRVSVVIGGCCHQVPNATNGPPTLPTKNAAQVWNAGMVYAGPSAIQTSIALMKKSVHPSITTEFWSAWMFIAVRSIRTARRA